MSMVLSCHPHSIITSSAETMYNVYSNLQPKYCTRNNTEAPGPTFKENAQHSNNESNSNDPTNRDEYHNRVKPPSHSDFGSHKETYQQNPSSTNPQFNGYHNSRQRVSTSDLQCVLICKYVINEINTNNIQYVSKLYKTTKKKREGGSQYAL